MGHIRLGLLSAALTAVLLGTIPVGGASAAALAPQTSSELGVSVAATPRDLSPTAKEWEFEIVLQTHSQDLSDDLKAVSTLVADGRATQAPTAWEGDPPGGHHRKGVLRFEPVTPRPETIELRIPRPGESSPRSFRWQLN
jgi:hypothetical protein